MDSPETIRQAMQALEGQRSLLGDAVVDTSLASLREKLATLIGAGAGALADQRKQVTVMFIEFKSLAELTDQFEPEDSRDFVANYFKRCALLIEQRGGQIEKFVGDPVMAVFGLTVATEADPENAIRAALAVRASFEETNTQLAERYGVNVQVRIGINTGLVLASQVGRHEGERFSVTGDPVNIAARLQQSVLDQGILISRATYDHVRGLFEVQVQAPLLVKGRAEAVQTYLVVGHRLRPSRLSQRGLEESETPLIGRQAELTQLNTEYHDAMQNSEVRTLTVIGEPGLGKSRLVREFVKQLDAAPQRIFLLVGRGTAQTTSSPYGLLRDLLAARFDILESDPAETVRHKLETRLAEIVTHDVVLKTHFIGSLLGYTYEDSPYLSGIQKDLGQIRERALTYLGEVFQNLVSPAIEPWQPTSRGIVMVLEDIHWADGPSLEAIQQIARTNPHLRLFILYLARPTLFDTRPQWAEGQPQLVLAPLTSFESQALVNSLLGAIENTSHELQSLILKNADGNPYYVEELVKMLIDEGILIRDVYQVNSWQVESQRLKTVRVPPTLVTVLQARLENLAHHERLSLQQAAVVGRTFWDATLQHIQESPTSPHESLHQLSRREFIYPREVSAFAGANEYNFKHVLLRDVAYESVLKAQRRHYHAKTANWLIEQSGGRVNEYASLIAEHFAKAGDVEQALPWLQRAGEAAFASGAFREAQTLFEQAVNLLDSARPTPDSSKRAALLAALGKTQQKLGDYMTAQVRLSEALTLARQSQNEKTVAEVLCWLSYIAYWQGRYTEQFDWAAEALRIAQAIQAADVESLAWRRLGLAYGTRAEYVTAIDCHQRARQLYQAVDDAEGSRGCIINEGIMTMLLGEYDRATELLTESLRLCQISGDRWGAAISLSNLGEVSFLQRRYLTSRQYSETALKIYREMGDPQGAARCMASIGDAYRGEGDSASASAAYHQALTAALQMNTTPLVLIVLAGVAGVLHKSQSHRAAELLGLALNHPAHDGDVDKIAKPILVALGNILSSDELAAALNRGTHWPLESAATQVLADLGHAQ